MLKKIFISGGTHGIGLATAIELANLGNIIITGSRSSERVESTKKILKKINSKNEVFKFNALNKKSILNISNRVIKKYQGVDILINNVGGGGRWGKKNFLDTDFQVWEDVITKNLFSAIIFTKAFLPYMLKKKWGRVISISSIYATETGSRPWFSISKSSLNSLMKNLASMKDLSSKNITFNTISPGHVWIKNTGIEKENLAELLNEIPRNQFTSVDEIVNLIKFIISPENGGLNGSNIIIDGSESKVIF